MSLSGTGITPVGFSPGSLDFGTVAVGTTSAAQDVTLTNQEGTSLAISSISTSGGYSQANNCPSSMGAGQSCTISVSFHPTVAGSTPGALNVSTDASPGTQPVGLLGIGSGAATPQLSFSPASLAFGDQEAGTTSGVKSVTVTNTSATSSLTINSISGSGLNYLASGTCASQMLSPGGTCQIDVSFQPASDFAPVSYPGAVTVSDSDSTSPQVIGLSGAGVAPVTASPVALDLGIVPVGSSSVAQTVTITNNHSAAEDLSIQGSGGFGGSNSSCNSSVPAGGNCSLDVTFSAPSGRTNGALTIDLSSGGFLSPQVVSLTGCGTSVNLTPHSLNFGAMPVGTTSLPETATLVNYQGSSLNITGASITGSNASDFAIANNSCGASLGPGAGCTLDLAFTPTVAGDRTGILNISDDECSPQQVDLLGGSSAGPFALTVSAVQVNGQGTVTSDPAGIDCGQSGGACSASFSGGTTVTLNATPIPTPNFILDGWGGACTGVGSCVLEMNADKQVTATFGPAPDFSISASPPTPDPVPRGHSSTSTVTVNSVNGFNGAVSLACSVQQAQGAPTCSLNPTSVTFDASGNATAVLTIKTGTAAASLMPPSPPRDSRPPQFLWLPIAGLTLVGAGLGRGRAGRRRLLNFLASGIFIAGLMLATSCGGGSSTSVHAPPPPPPAPITYTVTVTGTSGSTQHSTTVTLTVQ